MCVHISRREQKQEFVLKAGIRAVQPISTLRTSRIKTQYLIVPHSVSKHACMDQD